MVRATPVSQHERAMITRDLRELGRESAVYECEYEPRIGRWYLKTLRRDKTAANFVTTVVGTLETIVDNVTVDELVRFGQRSSPTGGGGQRSSPTRGGGRAGRNGNLGGGGSGGGGGGK
jgi:hypothetical protein